MYVTVLWLLLEDVRCLGEVAPEDGDIPLGIKMGVDDQSAGLRLQALAGRFMCAVPYDSVN